MRVIVFMGCIKGANTLSHLRVIVFMRCIKGANALSQLNPNPNPNLNPNLERSTCIKYILKLFSPCHLKLVNGIKEALRN